MIFCSLRGPLRRHMGAQIRAGIMAGGLVGIGAGEGRDDADAVGFGNRAAVRKTQPDGGAKGEGRSVPRMIGVRAASATGSGIGAAESSAWV